MLPARIVVGIQVFEAQWTDAGYLADVFARLCPVEVGRIAGKNDHAAGRIGLQLIGIELIANPDVKNAGDDCIDSVLRVSVWHELHAGWHLDPDTIGAGLGGLTHDDGQSGRWGNPGKGFQSISSGRTDLKTLWSGSWVRTIAALLTWTSLHS